MLNCILEINISMIHLDFPTVFISHFHCHETEDTVLQPKKQYLGEIFYHGHQVNSLYVYSRRAVRAYVADVLGFLAGS